MADKGRHGWFQEPAFSISSVKERIVRVMRYEKPKRFISVVSVVIVLLCSCGIASQPETVQNLVSKGEEDAEVTQFKEEVVDQTQEFTELKWSKLMDPETSHEFYFSESDMATDGFIVISDSEFYIDMYKLKTGSEVTPQCCHHTKIGK